MLRAYHRSELWSGACCCSSVGKPRDGDELAHSTVAAVAAAAAAAAAVGVSSS
eukprot:COSAG01_NODE_42070_length_444_cov_0.405797_1_plen_52_part_10